MPQAKQNYINLPHDVFISLCVIIIMFCWLEYIILNKRSRKRVHTAAHSSKQVACTPASLYLFLQRQTNRLAPNKQQIIIRVFFYDLFLQEFKSQPLSEGYLVPSLVSSMRFAPH